MRSRESGLSLVDVVLATALFAIVAALAVPRFERADDAIGTGGRRDRLERAADRALAGVLAVLRSGRVGPMAATGLPPEVAVRRVCGGPELPDFSAERPAVFEPEPVVLRFRTAHVTEEAGVREDLNGDGDLSDSYALGLLEVEESGSVQTLLARPLVLLALPDYAGDLDGDGAGDPLLTVSGDAASVNIHLLDREENGRIARTSVRTVLRLRNQEEIDR